MKVRFLLIKFSHFPSLGEGENKRVKITGVKITDMQGKAL